MGGGRLTMADDSYSALLQGMLAGTGEKPSMQSLLAQVAETNPRLAPVVNYLARRQAERQEEEANEATEITVEEVTGQRDSLEKLESTVRRLYRELRTLRGRNDALAAALGACYLCWGDDPTCPFCSGQGAPAWRPVDRSLFEQWIFPAVRVHGRRSEVSHSMTNPNQSRGDETAAQNHFLQTNLTAEPTQPN
jgi:hypothetical protein